MISLPIVKFCAEECTRQQSGEMSVWHMVQAYDHMLRHIDNDITGSLILTLGEMVEPIKNRHGYRTRNVGINRNGMITPIGAPPDRINFAIKSLVDSPLTADEWFKAFEEIHPFIDGNGRVGAIIYNVMRGTIDNPVIAPDFWG